MDVFQEAKTKPISIVSVYSYIPPRRAESKETTYFNCESKAQDITAYDRLNLRTETGYDNKLHRDDRQHFRGRGLDFYTEESSRLVPVRSSSEYGSRLPLSIYKPDRQYGRSELIRAEFFRKNGISGSVEEGYGSVVPV